jgi:hypothetical protein
VLWQPKSDKDFNGLAVIKHTNTDWELVMQKLDYSKGYFLIEVSNYTCKLIFFNGDRADYVEDYTNAGLTEDDLELYICKVASLGLDGWYPISVGMRDKLMKYFFK